MFCYASSHSYTVTAFRKDLGNSYFLPLTLEFHHCVIFYSIIECVSLSLPLIIRKKLSNLQQPFLCLTRPNPFHVTFSSCVLSLLVVSYPWVTERFFLPHHKLLFTRYHIKSANFWNVCVCVCVICYFLYLLGSQRRRPVTDILPYITRNTPVKFHYDSIVSYCLVIIIIIILKKIECY